MKRLGCMFLAVILSLALTVTPAMAKGGGGGGGSSGGGNGSSMSSGNSAGGSSQAGGKGASVSPGNSSNKGSAGSNKGSSIKDTNNKTTGKDKTDSKVQGAKKTGANSGKKVQGGVDLTRGNKQAVQERIKVKELQTVQKQFKDTDAHWAQNKIQEIQKLGLIQGYEDGSFKPDAPVTMTEAMVMAVNIAEIVNGDDTTPNIEDSGADSDETTGDTTTDETTDDSTTTDETADENDENSNDEGDVSDEGENDSDIPAWARNQARKASGMGIININRFHSAVQASRAETAVMLAKALELEPIEVDENAFTDSLKIAPEDVGYILALKEAGIITGTPDGKFNPNSAVTRAEIATMLANIVENVEDDEEDSEDESGDETTPPDADTGDQESEDSTDAHGEDTGTTNGETETGTNESNTEPQP